MSIMRLSLLALAVALVLPACHRELEDVPLAQQKIYFSDKFFDVKALGPEEAIIVGYKGKALKTTDAGLSFTSLEVNTDQALYNLAVQGDQIWACGQDGLLIHSADSGETWEHLDSGTKEYLFAIDFLDEKHGFIVGDKSLFLETTDGGKTWEKRVIETLDPNMSEDLRMAMQNPIFYDIFFLNEKVGWIVGEFGRILKTADGGETWTQQQHSLLGPESGIVDPMDIPTFFGIFAVNENEAYAAGLEGRIAKTTDGGETWSFVPMELEFPIHDPLYEATLLPDGTGWATGSAGEVVRRDPGDRKWRRADIGMSIHTWFRAVDFATAKNGWIVGGRGTVLYTEDGGANWRPCYG